MFISFVIKMILCQLFCFKVLKKKQGKRMKVFFHNEKADSGTDDEDCTLKQEF